MTYRERLETRKRQKREAEAKARLDARALQVLMDKHDAREARKRQVRIGQAADAAGLDALSDEVFAEVFAYLAASKCTTDVRLRLWLKELARPVPVPVSGEKP